MFTWVPTHKAIAEKLLSYENRQQELIDILRNTGETILNDLDADGKRISMEEIDPFTFFCYIYKYGPVKRLQRLRQVAEAFNIKPLPEDEHGIPSANAQSVWLFPYKKERHNNEVSRLWSFFKLALSDQITNEVFSDILTIKGTGKTKITEALFNINPDRYLPINTQSRPYLTEVLGIDPDFKNWIDYERIVQKVRGKTMDPFYKISYDAWKWNTSTPEPPETKLPIFKDADNIEKKSSDFNLHEITFIEALAGIEEQRAINLFFEKADMLIKTAGIDLNKIHAGVREDNRIQLTIARRYAFMLRRKSNKFDWSFILDSNDYEMANTLPYFDYGGYFTDQDGSQKYCAAQYGIPLKIVEPEIGDLWDRWLSAAKNYYNETKETRMADTFRRHTNHSFLKALYDKKYRTHIIDRSIAYGNYSVQKKLLERYKALLKSSGLQMEEYKWKNLGKNYWDFDADDFQEVVKKIPFTNLAYPLAIGVLKQLVSAYSEETKEALQTLFYGEGSLTDKIHVFRNAIDSLYKRVEPNLSSHHDERTIATYLAFFDADKYPLYKNSFYSKYCKLLGRRQSSTNEKYPDYINLLNDLINKNIRTDEELLSLYEKAKPPRGYADKNHLLLAQDLLYRLLDGKRDVPELSKPTPTDDREVGAVVDDKAGPYSPPEEIEEEPQGEQQFWWLNANPGIWSISDFDEKDIQTYTSHNKKGNKRRIYKYFQQLQKGDIMIGYESTPVKQIKALFEVTKGLHTRNGEELIEFEISEKFNVPVHWNELQNNPALASCEVFINNQGSLFKLSEEHFDIIREIIDEKNIAVAEQEETSKQVKYDYLNDPDKPFISPLVFKQILDLLKRKKNIILQGPPGVGKTFIARKIAYEMMGFKNDANIEMVQFHQSFSYEDFIQGLRPGKQNFELKNGVFYTFCQKAHAHPDRQFFFIIDEINRGNLSKIFGELMMLIEPDKRKEKFALKLTYAEDEHDRFYIPENLHIIGTMNTADRSLAIVDYALRRRFAFITLMPDFEEAFQSFARTRNLSPTLISHIVNATKRINDEIIKDTNLGAGFQIGHSYFCSYPGKMDEKTWFNEVVSFEIKPLLEEIWFDDNDKVKRIINATIV